MSSEAGAAGSSGPPVFNGFRSLTANFTSTPNEFFDRVLGHYPLRVVSVVGILIRSTLGWEDQLTGERRMEAELPLSRFLRPELSENSARQGLREAIAAGLVVETAAATNREGARYALRWADGEAMRATLERQRRAAGDSRPFSDPDEAQQRAVERVAGAANTHRGGANPGGPNIRPPNSGGSEFGPPINKRSPEKEKPLGNGVNPLNVGSGGEGAPGTTANGEGEDLHQSLVVKAVREVISLTGDTHSIPRWVQLYEVCLQNNATAAWSSAMVATKQAMTRRVRRPDKPGAYFNRVCVSELENRGIAVPKRSEEQAETETVRSMIAASLGERFGGGADEERPGK